MSVEEAAKTAAGGFKSWIPWIALPVVVALAGVGVGVSGVISHPKQHVVSIGALSSEAKTTTGYSCPAGAAIAVLDRGVRVLAQERNADSTWVSVRNPRDTTQQVWVPVGMVVVDADQGPITDLPLGAGCPTISLVPDAPVVVTPTEPSKPSKPANPSTPDTTSPAISQVTSSTPSVCKYDNSPPYADKATITATASDNVGVTGATISWSGVQTSGPVAMQGSGGTWTFVYNPPSSSPGGNVTFSVQVRDAAGNVSPAKTVVVAIDAQCLI